MNIVIVGDTGIGLADLLRIFGYEKVTDGNASVYNPEDLYLFLNKEAPLKSNCITIDIDQPRFVIFKIAVTAIEAKISQLSSKMA